MNRIRVFLLLLLLLVSQAIFPGEDRRGYPPFITGDGFREMANFVYDETNHNFDPSRVKTGDIIYILGHEARDFLPKYHHQIKNPYIIITHNSIRSVNQQEAEPYIDDPKLIAWFGKNVGFKHPKIFPIPIGLENRFSLNGDHSITKRLIDQYKGMEKDFILYVNFYVPKKPPEVPYEEYRDPRKHRIPALEHLLSLPIIEYRAEPYAYVDYMYDIARSHFVASPSGAGYDCHRHWEAMYMGAIPIIDSTPAMDCIYEDLPVIIIQDWKEVTVDFLRKKYREMQEKEYNYAKYDIEFWRDIIRTYQKVAREKN